MSCVEESGVILYITVNMRLWKSKQLSAREHVYFDRQRSWGVADRNSKTFRVYSWGQYSVPSSMLVALPLLTLGDSRTQRGQGMALFILRSSQPAVLWSWSCSGCCWAMEVWRERGLLDLAMTAEHCHQDCCSPMQTHHATEPGKGLTPNQLLPGAGLEKISRESRACRKVQKTMRDHCLLVPSPWWDGQAA